MFFMTYMQAWSVNWDTNQVIVELAEEEQNIMFACTRFRYVIAGDVMTA